MKNTSNIVKLSVIGAFLSLACFAVQGLSTAQNRPASDGPTNQGTRAARREGNERSGRDVFRFETFGNEGFWTDAVRLPAGVVAARVTPLQALRLGLQVDVDALDDATRKAVAAELKKDPTGRSSALFNDPAVTVKLINANAVAGMVVKDSNGDGSWTSAAGTRWGRAAPSVIPSPTGRS